MADVKDPAFELPPDPVFDPHLVKIGDVAYPTAGAFATLGPWQQRLIVQSGDGAIVVPAGSIVSFHVIVGDAPMERPSG